MTISYLNEDNTIDKIYFISPNQIYKVRPETRAIVQSKNVLFEKNLYVNNHLNFDDKHTVFCPKRKHGPPYQFLRLLRFFPCILQLSSIYHHHLSISPPLYVVPSINSYYLPPSLFLLHELYTTIILLPHSFCEMRSIINKNS